MDTSSNTSAPISCSWPRRKLLGTLISIGAAVATRNVTGAAAIASGTGQSDLALRVIAVLGHESSANAALSTAHEPVIESLLGQIFATPDAGPGELRHASAQMLRKRIRANIESDFSAGKITAVNGWWISDTEARCLELVDFVCG